MSSKAKARAMALRRQFEEEMRQAELLEQEKKRVEELRIQEEERKRQEEERRLEEEARVLAEQDRWCRELTARREEERRRKEVAMTLARDQWLAEEQRRQFEERTKAAEERAKAMEVEEVETMADPGAGPHIETKKRKRAGSRFTILGTLTTADGGSWRAENGRVCNPCHRLNRSCIWRQDNKKVRTCYFCQRGKISCAVNPANAEAGPSKRMRVGKGKGKARETEPESGEEGAGPSVRTKILTDLLEEQRLHNQRLLVEIAQIRGALFQMGKLIKGIVLDTHDITNHLMAKEEDGGRRAADEEVIDVDEESADGEEAKRVHAEEAGEEKEQEVEGEKEAEMEVVVEEEAGLAAGADETLP